MIQNFETSEYAKEDNTIVEIFEAHELVHEIGLEKQYMPLFYQIQLPPLFHFRQQQQSSLLLEKIRKYHSKPKLLDQNTIFQKL